MGLRIIDVKDKGELDKERVIFEVLKDLDITNYAVMDSTFDDEGDVSNKGRHGYRFPSKMVPSKDKVVLYTRGKKHSSIEERFINGNDGPKYHFFYWDRDSTVWNKDIDQCLLMQIIDSKIVK